LFVAVGDLEIFKTAVQNTLRAQNGGRNRLDAEKQKGIVKTRESELHKSFGIFGNAEYVSAIFINFLPFGSEKKTL
jgi:hypothetical protein